MPFTDPPTGDAALSGVYYIDYYQSLSSTPPDPDWSVDPYYTVRPENLSASDSVGGVGNCSWDWTFTTRDIEDNLLPFGGVHDFVHPWRSFYRLRCGSAVIMAGAVAGVENELGSEVLPIAAKTWEMFFPRWQYPFDPRPTHVNDYVFPNTFEGNESVASGNPTPTGLCYQAYQRDVALIAHDLLVQIRDSVPDRMFFNFGKLNNPLGILTNFQYTLGDSSGIDSTLSTLTGIGEGFDWWMRWDRQIRVGSPYRFGSQMSPSISYFIDADTPGLISLKYANDGIQGNHVLGRGAGLSSQTQLAAAYGYAGSQGLFSRLDVSYDYGDVRNQNQLDTLTKKSLALAIDPVRTLTIVVDPHQISNYWKKFRRGVAIYVTADTLFHQIDAPYRLKSWSLADENNTGNMLVTLTLDRIYPEPADFGNAAL